MMAISHVLPMLDWPDGRPGSGLFTIEISLSCAPQSLREHRNQRAKRLSVSLPRENFETNVPVAAFRHASKVMKQE
ncbi:hypothetical protein [Aminobacter aminovorans]|jgi:hypothetical protein|uniref:hypothetical protein n=1 Tax=Aminobacter aminovorans TaxID=83263 RepID=UPI001404F49B|nr:hypothetical protein [Aminobacter aminovorans]